MNLPLHRFAATEWVVAAAQRRPTIGAGGAVNGNERCFSRTRDFYSKILKVEEMIDLLNSTPRVWFVLVRD